MARSQAAGCEQLSASAFGPVCPSEGPDTLSTATLLPVRVHKLSQTSACWQFSVGELDRDFITTDKSPALARLASCRFVRLDERPFQAGRNGNCTDQHSSITLGLLILASSLLQSAWSRPQRIHDAFLNECQAFYHSLHQPW